MAGGHSVPEADTGDPSRIQALGSAVWVCGGQLRMSHEACCKVVFHDDLYRVVGFSGRKLSRIGGK